MIEAGQRIHGPPTSDLIRLIEWREPSPFFVEILGTRLGLTVRFDLLRTTPFAGLGVRHVHTLRERQLSVIQEDTGWRRGWESNPRIKVLQTSALPLGYRAA